MHRRTLRCDRARRAAGAGGTDERSRPPQAAAARSPPRCALVRIVIDGVLPPVGTGHCRHHPRPGMRRRPLPRRGRPGRRRGGCPADPVRRRHRRRRAASATRRHRDRRPRQLGAAGESRPASTCRRARPTTGATATSTSSLGNPPYLSQLAAHTTRRGASPLGGGPYADAAGEFLALAVRLARPGGGRVGLVLPQSILSSRDVGPIRADGRARRHDVLVVVLAGDVTSTRTWWCARSASSAVPPRSSRPSRPAPTRRGPTSSRRTSVCRPLPRVDAAGTLGDRATAIGRLPRRVLRAAAGRRRARHRSATDHERADRSRSRAVG